MPGWEHHWNDSWNYGWIGTLLIAITTLLVWGGLITLIILMTRRTRHHSHGPNQNHAQHILDERFAKGEIDKDEYHQRSQTLHTGH